MHTISKNCALCQVGCKSALISDSSLHKCTEQATPALPSEEQPKPPPAPASGRGLIGEQFELVVLPFNQPPQEAPLILPRSAISLMRNSFTLEHFSEDLEFSALCLCALVQTCALHWRRISACIRGGKGAEDPLQL